MSLTLLSKDFFDKFKNNKNLKGNYQHYVDRIKYPKLITYSKNYDENMQIENCLFEVNKTK